MVPAWTKRLAVTLTASQHLIQIAYAQTSIADLTLSSLASIAPTPTTSSSSAATPSGSSEPAVHLIKAGAGGFKFEPQEITNVSVGDIVSFEFYPPDHSVARAEFGSACVPYEYTGKDKVGFWSETQWVNNTNELTYFNITINSTEPIFFYCAAPDSCLGKHMVGAINPNTTQTLASQVQAAAAADFQVAPGEPVPGEATSTLAAAPTSTPTTTSTVSSDNSGSHKLPTGAIVGIAIGGVAFLAICAALFFFIGRSKSLKEMIKRQDNASKHDPHMSQYGNGGLASPGFQFASGYASPAQLGQQQQQLDYGFSAPPGYAQHHGGEQYPTTWSSPQQQQHHEGHMSMMSSVSGMSQQQIDEMKFAQSNNQPAVAELHSPPLGYQGFAAEMEAPNGERGRK